MFFERCCAVCGQSGASVCSSCRAGFRSLPGPVAGAPAIRARFVLDPAVREVVAALKYRRERRLSRWVANELTHLTPQLADVITWAPATPERVRWRGYDQAREIAHALGSVTGIPVRRLLDRDHRDQRQTDLPRAERLAGPSLRVVRPPDGVVVIVDDVVTTGSTLAAASRAITGAGAQRVVPVAFAATPRRPL